MVDTLGLRTSAVIAGVVKDQNHFFSPLMRSFPCKAVAVDYDM
jgi:hypothetical protein